ncbi:MAG: type ISP restriction/modification enzyme [Desulfococcaceae bacterium]
MINTYIDSISRRYRNGNTTEHSFRGDLQKFFEDFDRKIIVTNEPKRIECGSPDLILTKNRIPLGYIEAKDIGISLTKTENEEQLKRYRESLQNLILTDYLEFRLYRNGVFVTSVTIAEVKGREIVPVSKAFDDFKNLVTDFCLYIGQTIKSPAKLAEMMAAKARMLQSVMEKALTGDEKSDADSSLKDQMLAFKKILIHDIKPSEFADIYAQTIAYGMFAARLHDRTLQDFSRQEAAELIPKSNPFLRSLFGYIAGPDIDERIVWIVDALADVFRAADVAELMKDFGTAAQKTDPVIHFYETFLAEYNPKLRKSRGVWYTPAPVVNFIVRAVDDILKTEFGLSAGLADTSKTKIGVHEQGAGKTKKELHRVQILDPAAGTGTFLAEIVKQIYEKKFINQQGIWSSYVEEHLIPRLNGFEILMASYAMAHLKLGMLLDETGYHPKKQERLRIFLTNSLEEADEDMGSIFTRWLSKEASEANLIKRDTPIMVVIGNPPYSVSSVNKGEWIQNLIKDYKKDLNEKKLNLDDDYIKFIRYAQHFVDKNGQGIVAMITNNSFIDGITHRQMRKSLLETFDKIYILDLHGNAKKKEICPDGSADQNVFDIMQGVSINFFVKTGKKKNESGKIYHLDLWGKREHKYEMLRNNSVKSTEWKKLDCKEPYYFFVYKDFSLHKLYSQYFNLSDLFNSYSVGIGTKVDSISVDFEKDGLGQRIQKILSEKLSKEDLIKVYDLNQNTTWEYQKAYQAVFDIDRIAKYDYRPFDTRLIYYDNKFLSRSRSEVMDNFFNRNNVGIEISRTSFCSFISKNISDEHFGGPKSYKLPLYIYPETGGQQAIDGNQKRTPNLNNETVQKIAASVNLKFTPEKEETKGTFAPIDILDYIYAVLHSTAYREKYKEFLKIDFPRVPYPKDEKTFWQLVKIGGELRTIHLLENPITEEYITTYPKDGSNTVTRSVTKKDFEITDKKKKTGRVWINDQQYFDNVPQTAWEFYIGGYQPAQKWLKDRKNRKLNFDDILHYQKIIAALNQTDILMKKIDRIDFM